jgi:hypothetical protein
LGVDNQEEGEIDGRNPRKNKPIAKRSRENIGPSILKRKSQEDKNYI